MDPPASAAASAKNHTSPSQLAQQLQQKVQKNQLGTIGGGVVKNIEVTKASSMATTPKPPPLSTTTNPTTVAPSVTTTTHVGQGTSTTAAGTTTMTSDSMSAVIVRSDGGRVFSTFHTCLAFLACL